MMRYEEHSVGAGDPVTNPLGEADDIVGHTGVPELLFASV